MNKPNFFLVGAPKCGTTAMCNYLDQHPEIFVCPVKEPNYFDRDVGGPKAAQNIEEYLNLFRKAGKRKCGEGSVWYLFSQIAAKEIYNFNPDAKIIIMLRNPVDVIYSLHSQLVYDGYHEDIEDFAMAIEAQSERKKGQRIPKKCTRPEALLYADVVKFAEQIKRYINIFPKENIHVIIYDDFIKKTIEVYKETLEFLEVNPNFHPAIKVINSNKRVKIKSLQNFLVKPSPIISSISKLFLPRILRHNFKQVLKNLNTNYERRLPLEAKLRKRLQAEFAPEVERLSILLNRDLTFWSKN